MASKSFVVLVFKLGPKGNFTPFFESHHVLNIERLNEHLRINLKKAIHDKIVVMEFIMDRFSECSRIDKTYYNIRVNDESVVFQFKNESEMSDFHKMVTDVKFIKGASVFSERTDDSSAAQYFAFYGLLSQQQNMLQDYVRTSTYHKAVLSNCCDFENKVVLDVGAGSGILSFFAAQAGALRVYAIEASSMATHAETLVNANNMKNRIKVIEGKVEEIELPEMVDMIISEPIGYMLFNERMLETFLYAKKWLKKGGFMFPSQGDLHVAPFTDDALYMELTSKATFWEQSCFYGVDLTSLKSPATKEYFRQPVIDTFDIKICLAKSIKHSIDFTKAVESDLHKIEIPLEFHILESGIVHGLAFWFDIAFSGSKRIVWLSTCPTEPLTHWYQVRCLLVTPLLVKTGQLLKGSVVLEANEKQSYHINIDLSVEGIAGTRSTNSFDLKNPYFRYSMPSVSTGYNTSSPSESYWRQMDAKNSGEFTTFVSDVYDNNVEDFQSIVTDNVSNLITIIPNTNQSQQIINDNNF